CFAAADALCLGGARRGQAAEARRFARRGLAQQRKIAMKIHRSLYFLQDLGPAITAGLGSQARSRFAERPWKLCAERSRISNGTPMRRLVPVVLILILCPSILAAVGVVRRSRVSSSHSQGAFPGTHPRSRRCLLVRRRSPGRVRRACFGWHTA